MKKLALAICAVAFVAVAAPSFAEDMTPAVDTAAVATDNANAASGATDAVKQIKKHKRHSSKKHKKHQEVAKQDVATDAATDAAADNTQAS